MMTAPDQLPPIGDTERVLRQSMVYVERAQDLLEQGSDEAFAQLEIEANKLRDLLMEIDAPAGVKDTLRRDIGAIQKRLDAAQARLKEKLHLLNTQTSAKKAYRKKRGE
ncbi:MAG: hypothetical protein ACK5ZH_00325 [Alphaproteobacteria bacterium]|jgi:hypothetical protein|nr:hypothetical protein [Rickettsiales bacterium]